MTPAITFIIPAFNAAKTLGDTLRSLLAQTRKDWIALIVDDGSTDTTAEVAASTLDPRIRLSRQSNAGVAASRNRGLAMSTSPAVCFLDADDTIEPTFVSEMLNGLKSHDLIPAAYRYIGPNLEDANWTVHPSATDPAKLTEFNQYAIGAIVFNREALIAQAGPAPFPPSSRHEDWELLFNLQHANWAPPITTPLFSYRLRTDSRTTALCEIWRSSPAPTPTPSRAPRPSAAGPSATLPAPRPRPTSLSPATSLNTSTPSPPPTSTLSPAPSAGPSVAPLSHANHSPSSRATTGSPRSSPLSATMALPAKPSTAPKPPIGPWSPPPRPPASAPTRPSSSTAPAATAAKSSKPSLPSTSPSPSSTTARLLNPPTSLA
jgi:hypothetical protein